MPRPSRRLAMTATAAGLCALAVGCTSTVVASGRPSDQSIVATAPSLGTGDAVGMRLRSLDVLLTGRDAWDRNAVLADEALRLAATINSLEEAADTDEPAVIIASPPIPID